MHSVLVIDDHDIVRLGLEALLSRCAQLKVVAHAETLADGLAQIDRLRPELVISDMGLPDSSGLDTVRALVQAQAPRRVLLVTMQDESVFGESAMDLGVGGYLTKDSVQANLVQAVQTILQGGRWASERLALSLLNRQLRRNSAARQQATPGVSALSGRELEVLQLLRAGKSTKEIAGALRLSARTVDIHRANIKKKLGLRTGAELIAFASRLG